MSQRFYLKIEFVRAFNVRDADVHTSLKFLFLRVDLGICHGIRTSGSWSNGAHFLGNCTFDQKGTVLSFDQTTQKEQGNKTTGREGESEGVRR